MANYFCLISLYEKVDIDSFYLETQLKDKNLLIGWGHINPINKSKFEIKKLIEDFYPEYKSTVNPDNGSKSLFMFSKLSPGDIVFVRGDAKILDTVIISGHPYFDKNEHYPDCSLIVPFVPLFESKQATIATRDIPDTIRTEVLFEGGRSLVIRELNESIAMELLKHISQRF